MAIFKKILPQDIAAVQAPIAEASGLPNAAYTDQEVFIFERDHVIGKTWAGLEFASALPELGFAKPISFMGLPLVLIRDKRDDKAYFIMSAAIEVWF